jgi:hypothetical protein
MDADGKMYKDLVMERCSYLVKRRHCLIWLVQ